ncbi:hypothetical protein RclHR1_00450004 [Rhizophagus clarus]|uniref:FAR1 domain-containing protein n=1 Tax=Rhizophagus clarus TaxID=94130 RepID=A0A2Z6SBZ7_9GLOM|nr:hypothetical protein RclHR1_00450004 [Rhizophagus clarus]
MCDTFSSDDNKFFTNGFTGSIPDDIVSNDNEDVDFYSYDMSDSTLTKQTFVCHCEGTPKLTTSKTPSKSWHTNCKWYVNLFRPIKNNPASLVFVITFFNEHSGHNLDISACQFKASKAFTKPMLKDIEWMTTYGYLKLLAIKRMLKVKYNKKVYNQDLYKVIYKYRYDNNVHGNDVLRGFKCLEKCKDNDPRWIIYKD